MTTVGVEPIFVDTNVLVYASWQAAPLHTQARAALAAYHIANTPLVISRQVIRAFLATLARPRSGIPLATLIAEVHAFPLDFQILDETAATTDRFLALLAEGRSTQVHDTNIVATLLVAGVRTILTSNPGDFAPFASASAGAVRPSPPRIAVLPLV